jgi:hypothetical protein
MTGLGQGNTAPALRGGRATGGNICDDGSCSRAAGRRFYLTTEVFSGADADEPGVCDPGFRFASFREIQDLGGLLYDTSRGVTSDDPGARSADRGEWMGEFQDVSGPRYQSKGPGNFEVSGASSLRWVAVARRLWVRFWVS